MSTGYPEQPCGTSAYTMPGDLPTPPDHTDRAATLSLLVVDPDSREHEFWEHIALTIRQIACVGASETIEQAFQVLERRVIDLVMLGPGLSREDVINLLSRLRQLRLPPLTMVILDGKTSGEEDSLRFDSGATFAFHRHRQVREAIETLLTLSRNSEDRHA